MKQDEKNVEYGKIQEFADLNGRDVLEIGCGSGRVSAMLAPLVKSLAAIDPDKEQLDMARSKVPGVDFRLGRGEDLEFPSESFDVVVFTFSLHHLDGTTALAEAHRVLRPSGQVLVVEPSVDGEMHRFFRIFRDEDRQIAETVKAMNSSRFSCQMYETFDIEWVFDDAEDVYNYFFEHYRMSRDEAYVRKINALLGAKASEKPIRLAETVNIYSLIKI